jgi:acetylornithine deacetylase
MDHTLAQTLREGGPVDAALHRDAEFGFTLIERLVREPSVLGNEAGAQAVLAAELADLGFAIDWLPLTDTIADDPVAGVPSVPAGDRRVLVARLAGTGGRGRSLLVNGHLDVVPSGGDEVWRHPPFEPVREDGWLYGRGAGDMKAGLAMAVLAIRALLTTHGRPAADLTVVGAIEEECTGNGTLASVRAGVLADAVVLPEPTGLDVLLDGVGVLWVDVALEGRSGHALDAPEEATLLDGAWTVIRAVRALAAAFDAGEPGPRHHVNVGVVRAGDWPSTQPGSARLGIRIGFPSGLAPDEAEARVRTAVADAAASDPWLSAHPPRVRVSGFRAEGYALPPDSPLCRAMTVAHAAAHGAPPALVGTTGTTDARYYLNQAGVPALCYGPRVEGMHGVDERVELASVLAGARTLTRFMASWLNGAAP